MGKIKILHDPDGVYEDGSVHDIKEIIRDYCDCCTDESLMDYLYRISIPSAMAFICNAWSLEYEYV